MVNVLDKNYYFSRRQGFLRMQKYGQYFSREQSQIFFHYCGQARESRFRDLHHNFREKVSVYLPREYTQDGNGRYPQNAKNEYFFPRHYFEVVGFQYQLLHTKYYCQIYTREFALEASSRGYFARQVT